MAIQISANFVGAILPFAISLLATVASYAIIRGRFPRRRTFNAIKYTTLAGLVMAIPSLLQWLQTGAVAIQLFPVPLGFISLFTNLVMPVVGLEFVAGRQILTHKVRNRLRPSGREYIALTLMSYSTATFAALLVDSFFLLLSLVSTLIGGGGFVFTYGVAGFSDAIVTSGESSIILAPLIIAFLWIVERSHTHQITRETYSGQRPSTERFQRILG